MKNNDMADQLPFGLCEIQGGESTLIPKSEFKIQSWADKALQPDHCSE